MHINHEVYQLLYKKYKYMKDEVFFDQDHYYHGIYLKLLGLKKNRLYLNFFLNYLKKKILQIF